MKTNISIRILENDFHLVCDINEKKLLKKSAEFLNDHLKTFRRNNPSIDSDQLLLMGALRATFEAMKERDALSDQAKVANGEMQKALNILGGKVDNSSAS